MKKVILIVAVLILSVNLVRGAELITIIEQDEDFILGEFKVNCNMLYGGNDTDFCSDLNTAGSGDSKLGALPYLYNNTTHIILNTTSGLLFNNTNFSIIGTNYSRGFTKVICAVDSLDKMGCDYSCNGTADDDTINMAIAYLSGNETGTIRLREGTYNISDYIEMRSNIILEGSGNGTSLNVTGGTQGIYFYEINNAIVRNMRIFNSTAVSYAIKLELRSYPNEKYDFHNSITGITIEGFDYGIYSTNGGGNMFINNLFNGSEVGIYSDSGIFNIINDNIFFDINITGINIGQGGMITANYFYHAPSTPLAIGTAIRFIDGNSGAGTWKGYTTISGNIIDGWTTAIYGNSIRNVQINNNLIMNVWNDSIRFVHTGGYLYDIAGCYDIIISNNVFFDVGRTGINSLCDSMIIIGNIMEEHGFNNLTIDTDGIRLSGSKNLVNGNKIQSYYTGSHARNGVSFTADSSFNNEYGDVILGSWTEPLNNTGKNNTLLNYITGDASYFTFDKYIGWQWVKDNIELAKLNITYMNITGTNFSVDGKTFYVDSILNRVGIGTVTPQYDLDVVGNIYSNSWINSSSFNGTYYGNGSALTDINTFNTSYNTWLTNYTAFTNKFNTTATSNLNMSIYNTSFYLISNAVPICSKYYNGTILVWCDCYNSTHKWLDKTC